MAEQKLKQADASPRHLVLKMRPSKRAPWVVLASRVHGDPNADDDLASLRIEQVTRARLAGAQRPEFITVQEVKGHEVEAI
jgi:hypothetical protein